MFIHTCGFKGIHEKSETETLSPSEVISGKLIKKGMIRLPSLDRDILDKTLIVNYGESGRRTILVGEAIEVTIQFVSAKKHSIVYVCTAEGKGSTEPENVRVAINRALDTLFKT